MRLAHGEWWEPALGRIWPVGPPYYNRRIDSLVYVFERSGFIVCDTPEFEPGDEKIAIYGKDVHSRTWCASLQKTARGQANSDQRMILTTLLSTPLLAEVTGVSLRS